MLALLKVNPFLTFFEMNFLEFTLLVTNFFQCSPLSDFCTHLFMINYSMLLEVSGTKYITPQMILAIVLLIFL